MDDKLFKQLLSEVAEWKIPESMTESSPLNRVPDRRTVERRQKKKLEGDDELVANDTYAPMLVKLKVKPITCDDCGKVCENGRHLEKKLYDQGRKAHWREKCLTCGMNKNPYNGKFELNAVKSCHMWAGYLRETKGAYKSKGNLIKGIVESPNSIENSKEIITFYDESNGDD